MENPNMQPQQNSQVQQAASQPMPSGASMGQPQEMTPEPKKSNKMALILVIVVLVLVAGMGFYLLSGKKSSPTLTQSQITPIQEATVITPTPATVEEQEVDQVDVNDTAPTEIPQVEKDVQGL